MNRKHNTVSNLEPIKMKLCAQHTNQNKQRIPQVNASLPLKNKLFKWGNSSILFLVLFGILTTFQSCKKDKVEYVFNDKNFLIEADSNTRLKILACELAQSRSDNPDVKEYAASMLTIHKATQEEIAGFASKNGITLPSALLSHHTTNLNVLKQYYLQDYDKYLAELMSIEEVEGIDIFTQATQSDEITNAELKDWASGKLETLNMQLDAAQVLAAKLPSSSN